VHLEKWLELVLTGDNLVFDDEACSGVATSDLSGLNIFGGNARAVLSWTEPVGSPTGYNILRANATQQILWDEEIEISSLCLTDGRCEDLGTVADPLGFVGQRITFATDVQLTDIMLNLGYSDGFPFSDGDIDIQGVILKDAPVGTGSFTRVANSTFVKLGDVIVGDVTGGNAFLFNNFNNCCPEAFTFNNTILTAGVEYIIGVESFGTFSGTDKFLISHTNGTSIVNAPNKGLGVFTKLHVGTSDLWVDNSTENLLAMFMGLNFTEEVADTGNTNTEYTSTADFPSADGNINAYRYLVKAINSGGNANASNTSEISPDRSGFDLWDYREHDSRTFFDAECQFGNNDEGVFTMNNTSTAGVGSCDLFKSFNKTEMTGSDIKITINFTDSGRLFLSVIDGSYDKDDFAEFPMNSGHPVPVIGDPIKGIGRLNFTDSFFVGLDQCDFPQQVPLRQCEIVIPASDIDYAGSTEDEITLMLQVRQETAIGKIEISNVGSWDFTSNPRKVIGIDNGDSILISNGASNNQDDRGNLYSNGVFAGSVQVLPLPDQVTGLNITQNMNNNATLDWNDAVGADNYQVLRKTNFTTSVEVNTNGTWQVREVALSSTPNQSGCGFSAQTDNVRIRNSFGANLVSSCYMFKTFPRDFLNGTQIQINHDTTRFATVAHTSLVDTRDDPFQLQTDDESEWDVFTFTPRDFSLTDVFKVNDETIPVNLGLRTDDMISTLGQWQGLDTDYASIIIESRNTNIFTAEGDMKIFWINITDFTTGEPKAFYNFSGSTITQFLPHNLNCSVNTIITDCFRGIFVAGNTITTDTFEEVGTPITSERFNNSRTRCFNIQGQGK